MTSKSKWEAATHVDNHARVGATSKRPGASSEIQQRPVQGSKPLPAYSLFGPSHDPYSEAVADWNIGHHPQQIGAATYRASLDTPQGRQLPREANRRHSLSHKSAAPNSRHTGSLMGLFRRSHDKERKLKSSHEDNKPVPSASVSNGESSHSRNVAEYSTERPNGGSNHAPDVARSEKAEASPHDSGIHSELGRERGYLLRDSSQPVDLTGIVDLSHTEDTGVSITYAPEVTHETRYISTEEVIQEVITREIHNHDIYHRVLPILDYEVLPPRHFIPGEVGEDGGTAGLIEISADQIPISTRGLDIQAAIANAMSNMMPRVQHPVPARQFTARKFEGTEGDYKESITSEGFKRTETWWVHPPTLETDPERTGPTLPFHLHSETRDLDGFRDGVLDRSSDPRQYQILHSDDPSRAGVMKMRFPPPRGASLGKTSVAGVAATTAAAEPVVLPVRLVGRASEGGNKKGDGKKGDGVVGVAM